MKLVYHPHPALLKQVQPFDFDKLDAIEIEKQMVDIMTKEHGVGLSANQVDLDAQIFVMEPKELQGYKDGQSFAVINPKIEKVSEQTIIGEEGCLSFPGEYLIIRRPATCKVEWQDHKGNVNRAKLDNINARVWLHEYDHLMGITFQQRLDNKDIPEELRYAKT